LDGEENTALVHVVITDANECDKETVRQTLASFDLHSVTIEIDSSLEEHEHHKE
jgi:Co/Zn/Cd efflux system component